MFGFFGIIDVVLTISAVITISRLAETDRGEGFKWGAITFIACALAFFIPVPFLRTLLAIGLVFGLMTLGKKTYY